MGAGLPFVGTLLPFSRQVMKKPAPEGAGLSTLPGKPVARARGRITRKRR